MPLETALTRDVRREKLSQFTAHNHLVDLYHETLTTFGMRLLDHVSYNHYQAEPLWRRINLIVGRWEMPDRSKPIIRGAIINPPTPE